MLKQFNFDWDSSKDKLNQKKHGVSFSLAQLAFLDHDRVNLRRLGTQRCRKAVLLSWQSRWWNYNRKIHLSKQQNQNYWRRILGKGDAL